MNEVHRCPSECMFDWAQFHKSLDIATAHMINETPALPSKTTLLEFLQYSNAKRQAITPSEGEL